MPKLNSNVDLKANVTPEPCVLMLDWKLRPFYCGAGVDFRGTLTNLSPTMAAPPGEEFAKNQTRIKSE